MRGRRIEGNCARAGHCPEHAHRCGVSIGQRKRHAIAMTDSQAVEPALYRRESIAKRLEAERRMSRGEDRFAVAQAFAEVGEDGTKVVGEHAMATSLRFAEGYRPSDFRFDEPLLVHAAPQESTYMHDDRLPGGKERAAAAPGILRNRRQGAPAACPAHFVDRDRDADLASTCRNMIGSWRVTRIAMSG